MQKKIWFSLLMGFALAGCDDDTTATSTADMSVAVDMTATTTAAPGQGQLIIADVSGTLPTPIADLVNAHKLIVLASFPATVPAPDYSTLVFSPGVSTGCSVSRYDLTAGKAPAPNVDAGKITISGLNPATQIYSTSAVALASHPTGITCTNTAGSYNCVYGIDAIDGGADEITTQDVAASFYPGGSGEQHPFALGVNTNISMSIEGGNGYGAFSTSIGGGSNPIGSVMITDIKVGTTSIGSAIEGLGGMIDGTQPITFSYSCDGTATTGSGCPAPGTAPLDTVALLAQTSQAARTLFAQPPTETKFGIAQCLDQSNDPAHQIILDRNALAALLDTSTGPDGGVPQAGGSALLALVRLNAKINVTPTSQAEVFVAGRGHLGIVALP